MSREVLKHTNIVKGEMGMLLKALRGCQPLWSLVVPRKVFRLLCSTASEWIRAWPLVFFCLHFHWFGKLLASL